jgi:protein-L-isoaspartate(D-aspartate) O-methyltransferase
MEPMVLARLIQALQSQPEDKAMVVASGRGYGAALLSRLVKAVVAVESDSALAGVAEQTFKDLGIVNIHQTVAKSEAGAPADGPYDAILIEGAVPEIPRAILDQLAEGGRLTTVVAAPAGVLGVAQLVVKEGGVTSGRPLFDAGTPALPGFAHPARFKF